jgi:hypothetical protein
MLGLAARAGDSWPLATRVDSDAVIVAEVLAKKRQPSFRSHSRLRRCACWPILPGGRHVGGMVGLRHYGPGRELVHGSSVPISIERPDGALSRAFCAWYAFGWQPHRPAVMSDRIELHHRSLDV